MSEDIFAEFGGKLLYEESSDLSTKSEIENAKRFIRQHEGFKSTTYKDTGGINTIGFGRTGKDVRPGMTTTPEKESAWVNKRLHSEEVAFLQREGLPVNASIISTIYNMGWPRFKNSSLYPLAKQGKWNEYANELNKFVYDAKKQRQQGLVNRRKDEGDYIRKTLAQPVKSAKEEYKIVEVDGKRARIPAENVPAVLADHPTARVVKVD